jgi:transcriptional regulator with XRE-family HTH domain
MTNLAENVERQATMSGDQLRDLRKSIGITQATMADCLGLTRPHYNLLETGKRTIEHTTALAARHIAHLASSSSDAFS